MGRTELEERASGHPPQRWRACLPRERHRRVLRSVPARIADHERHARDVRDAIRRESAPLAALPRGLAKGFGQPAKPRVSGRVRRYPCGVKVSGTRCTPEPCSNLSYELRGSRELRSPRARAIPKSVSLATPSQPTRTFSGLMSRCRISKLAAMKTRAVWMASKPSRQSARRPGGRRVRAGDGLVGTQRGSRGAPSAKSSTKERAPRSSRSTWWTGTTFPHDAQRPRSAPSRNRSRSQAGGGGSSARC